MSKYVVLDLEMCKVSKEARAKGFKARNELIQIGAVELDGDFQICREFNSLVKPEFGAVDAYIHELTGISQKDLKDAPTAAEVLTNFYSWLSDDSVFVTWSNNDVKQIDDELYYKDIELSELYDYLDNYLDCQELFGEKLNTRKQYKLSEALGIANIVYDVNMHDALVDARNTARLFAKVQNEEELVLSPYFMTQEQASMCIFDSFAFARKAV